MSAAVTGSVMILAILALRAAARMRLPAGLFRALWILAAVRLLMPEPLVLTVKLPAPMQTGGAVTRLVTAMPMPMPAVQPAPAAAINPAAVLRIVHLAGIVITAGFFLFAYARLRKIAHRGEKTLIRGVWVHTVGGFQSPFTCGILRPVICLPEKMLTLPGEQLDCILAHERAHIRRLDQPVKWLILAAVCVHWWNPAVWLMLRYASRDIELACDAVVAGHTDAAAYAMCLIAAEEARSMPEVNAFGAPAIRERIECIMKKKHLTVCSFICAALILAAATPFFVDVEAVWEPAQAEKEAKIQAAIEAQAEKEAKIQAEIEAQAEKEAKIQAEMAAQAEKEAKIQAEMAAQAEKEAMIQAEMKNQALKKSIELVFPLNAEYRITQGYSDAHPAVDIAAAEGSEILAVLGGIVSAAGYDYTLGHYVEITHDDRVTSLYAHCNKLAAEVGDAVTAGEVVAWVGRTGAATGAHLHFEMRVDGVQTLFAGLFDPADFPKKPF